LNHLCHSKIIDFFRAYSPYANVNMANISQATSTNLYTKHDVYLLFQILSLIFLPILYNGHLLFLQLLRNGWFIWSLAYVNTRWNTSKHAWVHEFLPDSTAHWHTAAILGIKFLHYVLLISFDI
jgi:hypothetical protein